MSEFTIYFNGHGEYCDANDNRCNDINSSDPVPEVTETSTKTSFIALSSTTVTTDYTLTVTEPHTITETVTEIPQCTPRAPIPSIGLFSIEPSVIPSSSIETSETFEPSRPSSIVIPSDALKCADYKVNPNYTILFGFLVGPFFAIIALITVSLYCFNVFRKLKRKSKNKEDNKEEVIKRELVKVTRNGISELEVDEITNFINEFDNKKII